MFVHFSWSATVKHLYHMSHRLIFTALNLFSTFTLPHFLLSSHLHLSSSTHRSCMEPPAGGFYCFYPAHFCLSLPILLHQRSKTPIAELFTLLIISFACCQAFVSMTTQHKKAPYNTNTFHISTLFLSICNWHALYISRFWSISHVAPGLKA